MAKEAIHKEGVRAVTKDFLERNRAQLENYILDSVTLRIDNDGMMMLDLSMMLDKEAKELLIRELNNG
jgi:hypothetical protein